MVSKIEHPPDPFEKINANIKQLSGRNKETDLKIIKSIRETLSIGNQEDPAVSSVMASLEILERSSAKDYYDEVHTFQVKWKHDIPTDRLGAHLLHKVLEDDSVFKQHKVNLALELEAASVFGEGKNAKGENRTEEDILVAIAQHGNELQTLLEQHSKIGSAEGIDQRMKIYTLQELESMILHQVKIIKILHSHPKLEHKIFKPEILANATQRHIDSIPLTLKFIAETAANPFLKETKEKLDSESEIRPGAIDIRVKLIPKKGDKYHRIAIDNSIDSLKLILQQADAARNSDQPWKFFNFEKKPDEEALKIQFRSYLLLFHQDKVDSNLNNEQRDLMKNISSYLTDIRDKCISK